MMAKLLASVALALPLVLLGAPRAEASTWQGLCDTQSTPLCVTADGVNGDSVIGATQNEGQADQNIFVGSVNGPCGTPRVADGDSDDMCSSPTWWPWGDGFHFLDTASDFGIVAVVKNRGNCLVSGQAGNAQILQDQNCGAGHLWVFAVNGDGTDSVLIGVAASQNHSGQELMGANGTNHDLTTQDVNHCTTILGNITNNCRWRRVS